MALTNLSKGVFATGALLLTLGAAWQLGVKDLFNGEGSTEIDAPETSSGGGFFSGLTGNKDAGPLGRSCDNPLKVSIVSFHGYAPALVANGNSLVTRPGSIYAEKGICVEFLIQDDVPSLVTTFGGDIAHISWRTSDFFAQEHPALRASGLDAKAFLVVDNTRGADAIIAKDPAIQSVEDLAGKRVGLLQFTPSDGMTIDALANSSLSRRKRDSVEFIYVSPDEGTAGVRALFESGNVDAVALWDPDLSLALQTVPGAHSVYSTNQATNLIYDVMVANTKYLEDPANEAVFQAFVDGWLSGIKVSKDNPDKAVQALVNTEDFFSLLAEDEGSDFIQALFENLLWTGLEDNARILGLAGNGTNHYERVYHAFDEIYRNAGYTSPSDAPVIHSRESFDYRFIQNALNSNAPAQQAAAQPEFTFSAEGRQKAVQNTASLTKPVAVNFPLGGSDLSKRAQQTIDFEMVPLIESNGASYFIVSGNTDSTGGRSVNLRISEARAQAVVDYLVSEWEFDEERFSVVGNGPDQPICNESDPGSSGYEDLRTCRDANRNTRIAPVQGTRIAPVQAP